MRHPTEQTMWFLQQIKLQSIKKETERKSIDCKKSRYLPSNHNLFPCFGTDSNKQIVVLKRPFVGQIKYMNTEWWCEGVADFGELWLSYYGYDVERESLSSRET